MRLDYSSNNSGGSWWLSDKDWLALEANGWKVDWYATREDRITDDYVQYGGKKNTDRYPDGRFLGALASGASRIVASKSDASDAIDEFERITGANVSTQGCNCCGQPHYFSLKDEVPCTNCDLASSQCSWCDGTGIMDVYIASFDSIVEVRKGGWSDY